MGLDLEKVTIERQYLNVFRCTFLFWLFTSVWEFSAKPNYSLIVTKEFNTLKKQPCVCFLFVDLTLNLSACSC